jgi:hypothetical protein
MASVRRSMEALATFCGSLPETNPQKVALQRTCSCLKVHSEKRGQMGHKPYSTWSVRGRHLDHRFCGIGVRGISITFDHKWLKSSLTEFSEVQPSPVPNAPGSGMGGGVFSPKHKLMFVERTSMVAHIYPSVLQALAGRGRTERLEGEIAGDRGEAMQDLGYELPRIHIPRTLVNRRRM